MKLFLWAIQNGYISTQNPSNAHSAETCGAEPYLSSTTEVGPQVGGTLQSLHREEIVMAGEWIKFEASTPDKPEVFAITAAMGWDDPDLTVGKLLRVWRWFDQQTIEGNAPNVTLSLLDRISTVTGFAKAMCDVGWLEVSESGVTLPNFDRHNGKTAKDRALTAKRVAKHKTKEPANDKSNDKSNGVGVTGALPKEEKRREEGKTTPIPPKGAKRSAVSLQTYLEKCKEAGCKPIPEGHSVFGYTEKVGIPDEFLRLQWIQFKERYTLEDAKRYKAWATVFYKSVVGNWFKLWYLKNDTYELTTVGLQAQRSAA